MDRLLTLEVFARVGEALSFTRAAEALQLPRSTVSAAVRELEAHLGTRLVNRTTRKVSLTADGAAYLDWCRRLLADIEETDTRMRASADGAVGRLRVDVPGRVARRVICPALPDFLARHPRLALEMRVSDRTVDLVEAGVDCAIRVGELADTTLVARAIGPLRMGSFASRAYLAACGVPRTPDELAGHRMIHYAGTNSRTGGSRFWYVDGGVERFVDVDTSLVVDDAEAYIACCRAGLGIVQVPAYDVRELVRCGEIAEILDGYSPAPMPLAAVYPERRHFSGRVRAFVDWVQGLYDAHMSDGSA